jgi:hypothetical protein
MKSNLKKRRDELLEQYWLYENLPASQIPNSILGYWQGLLENEPTWECRNIISCIVENLKEKFKTTTL